MNEHSFADAALVYMKSGGERTYLAPILELIGKRPLVEITQEVVQDVVDRLKPGCAAATINRSIFTPILAVLNYAADVKMCPPPSLSRPKGHDKAPRLVTPDEHWFNAVLPEFTPTMRACILTITLHGLRIAEAIERTPEDLDTKGWRLTIPDTKAGEPVVVALSEPVIEAIKEMGAERRKKNAERLKKGERPLPEPKWLFGTCHRSNVARAIKQACKRAGVRSFGTHCIGRHSFSVRVLREGKSVKFLMTAGRWKTAKMPMVRYGHLERSEVGEEVNEIASKWGKKEKPAELARLKKA